MAGLGPVYKRIIEIFNEKLATWPQYTNKKFDILFVFRARLTAKYTLYLIILSEFSGGLQLMATLSAFLVIFTSNGAPGTPGASKKDHLLLSEQPTLLHARTLTLYCALPSNVTLAHLPPLKSTTLCFGSTSLPLEIL